MNKNRRCPKCDGIVRDDGDYLCVNCRVEISVDEVEILIGELDCAMLRLRCIKEDLERQLERLGGEV